MSAPPAASPRTRPLVVVAEDGPDARMMLGVMLEFRGFDVVLTVDGRDALEAVLVHRPDAVVSDLDMPHLDGLGLCRAVRAMAAGVSLPVILWSSARADDPRLLQAIALGGVEWLSKSATITGIERALRQALRLLPTRPGEGPRAVGPAGAPRARQRRPAG